jgi:uncharacterized protein YdaU (DUF1376 family)
MKDPAFLFYPGDWLSGTIGMTFEEKGAYMELLMAQFSRGHMTDHMCGQVVGHLWGQIKFKFKQDSEGLWFNERLDIEKEKRKNFVNSRKNNVKGSNQYQNNKQSNGHVSGHMTSHMENRNRNRNDNSIIINNESKNQNWFKSQIDEIYLNNIQLTHKGKNIDEAISQAYAHLAADPERLQNMTASDCKRFLNGWLSNMKAPQAGGRSGRRNITDEEFLNKIK